jgi:Ribbon-helix-helix protein, copG family
MTPPRDGSRFDALFGAARAKATDPTASETVQSSDVQTSKSKDPGYQRTTVYLPKATHRKLKASAAEDDREMSDIIEELVQQWLESRKNV